MHYPRLPVSQTAAAPADRSTQTLTHVILRRGGRREVYGVEDHIAGGVPQRLLQPGLPDRSRHGRQLGRLVQQLGARALEHLVTVQLALSEAES